MDPRGTGMEGHRRDAVVEAESKVQKLYPPIQRQFRTADEDKWRKTKKHGHANPANRSNTPTLYSRAAQLGDTPNPKGEMPGDTMPAPIPGVLGAQHSVGVRATAVPLDSSPLWEGKESLQSAHESSPLAPGLALPARSPAGSACEPLATPSPTRTGSREGPALRALEDRIGWKALRVPPCARQGTGLDEKPPGPTPRWREWAVEVLQLVTWSRPSRLPRLRL